MKLALCPDGIQSPNREADARLIASSPVMRAALQRIIDCDDMAGEIFTNDKDRADHFADIARQALTEREAAVPRAAAPSPHPKMNPQ